MPYPELTKEDRHAVTSIQCGKRVSTINRSANTHRLLVSKILFQFADSELAGAAGYADRINFAPTIDDRLHMSRMTFEKTEMAHRTYALLQEHFDINLSKYIALHSWESRLGRHAQLEYKRAASDKRLNALMYPLQSWPDVAVFTFMMATMAEIQLQDFRHCSFQPWNDLVEEFLPLEHNHAEFGREALKNVCQTDRLSAQVALNYWYNRVASSFGPPSGEGNKLYMMFGLKKKSNEELHAHWQEDVLEACRSLRLSPPLRHENA